MSVKSPTTSECASHHGDSRRPRRRARSAPSRRSGPRSTRAIAATPRPTTHTATSRPAIDWTCALVSRCATIQRVTGIGPRTARRLASSRGASAERNPAEPDPHRKNHQAGQPTHQHGECAPARHRWECQQRKEHECDAAEPGAEQRESLEARRVESEGLQGDGVAEGTEVFGDERASLGGGGSAGFTRHREEPPERILEGCHVSIQPAAALEPRLDAGVAGEAPTSARADLPVSAVISPASISSATCCS